MVQMWEQQINQKQKQLQAVIPIIVYQGVRKWKVRSMQEYFPGMGAELKKYLPSFDYELNDVNQIPENKLLELDSKSLTMALYSMANYRALVKTLETFDQQLMSIQHFEVSDKNLNFVNMVFVYLMKTNKINPTQMKDLLEKSKSKTMQKVKSTYDQIIDEGIKIGREEGIEKGIEKGREEGLELGLAILKAYKSGETIQTIASMFEISPEKVKSIVNELG